MPIGDSREVALSAAARLAELIRADGSFLTCYDASTRAEIPHYNVARQAGSIWALNIASKARPFLPEIDALKRQALIWLLQTNLSKSPEAGLCMVEDSKTRLGANTLTLLAILSFPEQLRLLPESSSSEPPDLVAMLCDHMLAQVISNGDMHHIRDTLRAPSCPFGAILHRGSAAGVFLPRSARARSS
jgi:hypothetical protein